MKEAGEVLNDVFCIFPQFNFAMGLFDIYYNANIVKGCTSSKLAELACKAQNVTYSLDPWAVADGGIGRYTISLALEIPALFALLYLVEWESTTQRIRSTFKRCLKTIKCKKNKKQIDNANDEETDDIEDDDVAAMRKTITTDGMYKIRLKPDPNQTQTRTKPDSNQICFTSVYYHLKELYSKTISMR